MIIHTVMGNRSHPEYGVAKTVLPASTECLMKLDTSRITVHWALMK